MPILVPSEDGAPLNQGDVLKNVQLFSTGNDWQNRNALPVKLKAEYCLVISRACVIGNKAQVVVAAIQRGADSHPRNADNLEKVLAYLSELRDGVAKPDRFYLGAIPGGDPGRYYAMLDSLHTIQKPAEEKMVELLRQHRVACLQEDFRRDLHVRFFSAFTEMGFDDYGWMSDSDLDWVIKTGKADIAKLQGEKSQKEADLSGVRASGPAHMSHQDSLEKAIAEFDKKVKAAEDALAGYENEQQRRQRAAK